MTLLLFQIRVQGIVPLCSWQYERIFNTVRVPGVESDKIVHYQVSFVIKFHLYLCILIIVFLISGFKSHCCLT